MKYETMFLTSGKCSWGECYACGWGRLTGPDPKTNKLKSIIDRKFKGLHKSKRLRIFASGSFFDDKQFPREVRKYIFNKARDHGFKELVVESRPEFITNDRLNDCKDIQLIVAIGLEVADNNILKKYRKGFTVENYIQAAEVLKICGCKLRTYLMVGMPFIKDHKKSLKKSVSLVKKYSDEIVLINTFPHREAPIFDAWIAGKWKPLDKEEFKRLVDPYKGVETDFDNFAFVPKFHRDKEKWIKGATIKNLLHPYFEVWQDYLARFFEPPKENDIAFFTMCSFKKPYRKSTFFKNLLVTLKEIKNSDKLHILVVSTPGVVPFELSYRYPFDKYDWPEWEETPKVKKKYLEVTEKRVYNYLKSHSKHYKKFYCYLKPDSESYQAVHNACKKLKIKIIDCIDKENYELIKDMRNPLSTNEALSVLIKKLKI